MSSAATTVSCAYHYAGFGIKGDNVDRNKYAKYAVGVRQEDFVSGNEINTDTDNGHTGVGNLDMGSYRKDATSSPSWKDAIRFTEGFEDMWYLLLGTHTKQAHQESGSTVEGVFDHHFEFPPINPNDLPVATVYNGFAKTTTDARVWNNALLNELKVTFADEDNPTIEPTFVSDYNNLNMTNPTRNFSTEKHLIIAQQTKIYLGAVGATEAQMLENSINCFTSAEFTVNNNAESHACHDDDFGMNTKYMGQRETTGSLEFPWNEGTKYLETEYEAFDKYGHVVSTEIVHKQLWYEINGAYIGNTNVPYHCLIKFPEIEWTKVESQLSGEDTKSITGEFKVIENPTQSFMTVDLTTDLENLHIDDTGIDRTSLEAQLS